MKTIVIELTNSCNLNCIHCFSGRHGGKDFLPLEVLEKITLEAKQKDFDFLSFTGGEPTLHPNFDKILDLVAQTGYSYGIVTNGINFPKKYPLFLKHKSNLRSVTFSIEGATEETHERLRGKGSFKKVLKAMSLCVALDIPFSNNMTVTAYNRHELSQAVELLTKIGSHSLRFSHLIHSPLTSTQDFDLSPDERKQVESEIHMLIQKSAIEITLAAGSHTTSLFPCSPLHMKNINVDCQGNLSKCCNLSSYGDGAGTKDIAGDLKEVNFIEAYNNLVELSEQLKSAKQKHLNSTSFQDTDYFPCWYCTNYFEKLNWLEQMPDNPWHKHLWSQQH